MNKFIAIVKLIRPEQWTKNLFVFLPLFFDSQLTNFYALGHAIVAFIGFSFAASFIYCLNDIIDIESDKLHPKKCKRPIASGAISKTEAYLIMPVLAIASLLVTYVYGGVDREYIIGIILFYIVLNIFYTLKLKHYAIIDVLIISIGFVLRIWAGGIASSIELSHWIVIMTFLLALFLAFAKRRDDLVIYEETGVKPRENISRYNMPFINSTLSLISAITIVSYIMYTVSDDVITRLGSPYIYLTSIFVIAGILRYLQLTQVDKASGSPTKILLKDRFIQIVIIGWVTSFFMIIYIL